MTADILEKFDKLVDQNILYHKKVDVLEIINANIIEKLNGGDARMDKMETSIEYIKGSQFETEKSIQSIGDKLDNGLMLQTKENSITLRKLSDLLITTTSNCKVCKIEIDKIEPMEQFINGTKTLINVGKYTGIAGISGVILILIITKLTGW